MTNRDLFSGKKKTIGAYEIGKQVGRGGMGEVYLARDERLGRRVAIKILPISLQHEENAFIVIKHEARAGF
jgi:serine/threonine-protein kinase